jgi:hypothetical protein
MCKYVEISIRKRIYEYQYLSGLSAEKPRLFIIETPLNPYR